MRTFIKVLIIMVGIVLGSYLGSVLQNIEFLKFLSYGKTLGLTEPFVLDLGFLKFTFGFVCTLNLGSIVGFIIAMFIVKKAI